MNKKIEHIWKRTRALRFTIEAHRDEGDGLHHLPDAIARAFVEANVYRLLLPSEFGGENVDPLTYYDLVEEVSSYDGSAGWNHSIGSSTTGHPWRSVPRAARRDLRESRFVCRRIRVATRPRGGG